MLPETAGLKPVTALSTAASPAWQDEYSFESGAFSDAKPWDLDRRPPRWRRGLGPLRSRIRAQVPKQTRQRNLPPLRRLLGVSLTLGQAVLRWRLQRRSAGDQSTAILALRLRRAAEFLGPTYIKLGQIIASGHGVFPEDLVREFKACQDRVAPERFETVRRIVEEDLGAPLSQVFVEFDEQPLAAASIAQVHRAVVAEPGGGRVEVVVKVQRPDIAARVTADLEVMSWLGRRLVGRIPVAALANPPALVEVFAQSIVEELDFRLEAENMLDVAESLGRLGQTAFVVPRPHPALVTERVLVMERFEGFHYENVAGMADAGIDTEELVRSGMVAFIEGCLIHGLFHGDLHGGNLFVLPDGRTALLDYGIVGRLTEPRRVAFLKLVLSSTMGNVQAQLEALRDLGALPPDADLVAVATDLGLDQPQVDPTTLSQQELADEMNRVVKSLLGSGARLPRELMLFAKNLVFLDGAIATLAPDLDLLGEIKAIGAHFASVHGNRLAADIGIRPEDYDADLSALKGQFGFDPATEEMSYQEMRERRELILSRLTGRDQSQRIVA